MDPAQRAPDQAGEPRHHVVSPMSPAKQIVLLEAPAMLPLLGASYGVNRVQALVLLIASVLFGLAAAWIHRLPAKRHLRPVRSYAVVAIALVLVLVAVGLSDNWIHHENPDSSPAMWCSLVFTLYFLLGAPVAAVLSFRTKRRDRRRGPS